MTHRRFARRRRPAVTPPAEAHEARALRAQLGAPRHPPTLLVIPGWKVKLA